VKTNGYRWPWQSPKYVAVKFNTNDVDSTSVEREVRLLQRLATADHTHRGFGLVRKPIDDFEITTEYGTHLCLVFEPMRETLDLYRRRFPKSRLHPRLVKAYARILLVALDYIHTSAHVVHTGDSKLAQ
jgi:serine/threonine-protein kinase SRPK3